MKKFVRFYYRCSYKVCLWAVLSVIGLTVLSSSAFASYYGPYTYLEFGGTVTIIRYSGTGGNVVIPSTINGMPVVKIDGYYDYQVDYYFGAFQFCSGLTGVTIPVHMGILNIRYQAAL